MVYMDSVPVLNPDVVGRFVGDEAVLVIPNKGKVKVLNEVGARIWSLIDGKRTVDDIVVIILREFTVSYEDAKRDTQVFLSQLVEREIVTFPKRDRTQSS